MLKITQQTSDISLKYVYAVWAHANHLFYPKAIYIYISKLYMRPTFSNMFQNDNVANDLIHGLVNDHGFEDMVLSSVTLYTHVYTICLNNLGYYKH